MDASSSPARRVLHSQAREIIYNVYKYFSDEKANGAPLIDISKALARAARATNISERTISRICTKARNDAKEVPENPVFLSPTKANRTLPVTRFDDFDQATLRRTVLQFYERREIPTLHKIREELKDKMGFSGCIESLRKVLQRMGFQFAKIDGRKFLMERNDVVAARKRFLREIRQLKKSTRNVVYLDETWVNQNYTVGRCWIDSDSKQANGIKQPTGKGSRLIILHAGSRNGFVDNAELVFQAKNDGDYHNQMNSAVFEKWFREQLLPNIPPSSVIVMDNAAYHSMLLERQPNTNWRKMDIKDWVVKKGAHPSDELSKAELLELARNYFGVKKYVIDTLAAEAGHRVVRLPPYHCQYNPIELIWAQVKSYVAKRNNFKMADLKLLVKEALSCVSAENWAQAVRHAEDLQEKDAQSDIAVEHFVESFVINIDDESSGDDMSN